MNVFQIVRQNVTARQAVEFYGLKPIKGKMYLCPFHDDHDPSMAAAEFFKCFACNAHGDATEFVKLLFHLPPKQAAEKIIADFHLTEDGTGETLSHIAPDPVMTRKPDHRRWILDAADVLIEYRDLLRQWKEEYAPIDREAPFHPKFEEALRKLDMVEELTDMATSPINDEREAFYNNCQYKVEQIRQRLDEIKGAALSSAENYGG